MNTMTWSIFHREYSGCSGRPHRRLFVIVQVRDNKTYSLTQQEKCHYQLSSGSNGSYSSTLFTYVYLFKFFI